LKACIVARLPGDFIVEVPVDYVLQLREERERNDPDPGADCSLLTEADVIRCDAASISTNQRIQCHDHASLVRLVRHCGRI
jgi:hypothetical protein